MYQKEEVAEARDTNTEFTCQYESSDLSIFQHIALGAQRVTLAYNEASFLSQNMSCNVTMLQSRPQPSTLNPQGHLVIL